MKFPLLLAAAAAHATALAHEGHGIAGDSHWHATDTAGLLLGEGAYARFVLAHAQSRGLSPTQFAIAWVLNNQRVHGVIGGPRTLAQWNDYLQAQGLEATLDRGVCAGQG